MNNNLISNLYKNLIQYSLKKGKKYKMENNFHKALLYLILIEKKNFENEQFNLILKAVKNTTPCGNIKMKKKGAQKIPTPLKITVQRATYLSSSWLISNTKLQNSSKFYKKLINELIDSSKNLSNSSKKNEELNNLVYESLNNINIRTKIK